MGREFGIDLPLVSRLLEQLPGADKCSRHKFTYTHHNTSCWKTTVSNTHAHNHSHTQSHTHTHTCTHAHNHSYTCTQSLIHTRTHMLSSCFDRVLIFFTEDSVQYHRLCSQRGLQRVSHTLTITSSTLYTSTVTTICHTLPISPSQETIHSCMFSFLTSDLRTLIRTKPVRNDLHIQCIHLPYSPSQSTDVAEDSLTNFLRW